MAGGEQATATYASIPNKTADNWWNDSGLRKNVFFCFGCMLCPFYLVHDQSLLTGLQAIPQWNTYFSSPSGNWLGLISATIFIPGIFIGYPTSWISSRYGRRLPIYIGSVLIIAGGLWTAFSQTTGQFMGARVLIGTGGAMTKVAAPALLQESAHPRLRAKLAGMYFGMYYVGSLLSALMCIGGLYITGEWGWRMPCIIQILGPILVISILAMAPESPRFLVKQGKFDSAHEMLAKYHANGDLNDPLVLWELKEIQVALENEALGHNSSYLDFLRTPGNRKRLVVAITMAFGINWVGNGIVSYYLSPVLKTVGVTKPVQTTGINAGLAVWNLIIAQTAGFNSDRIGRRALFFISTIGMIISYAFVMGFSAGFATTGSHNLGIAAIPFLFFFYGFYDVGWTVLNYNYVSEILPYTLRTKGLAIYQTGQSFGAAFNQFINPIALAALTWKYYAVYIAIDIGYVVLIYFMYPETRLLSIEEVAIVFDYGTKEGRARAAEAMEEAAQHTDARSDKPSQELLENTSKPSSIKMAEINRA